MANRSSEFECHFCGRVFRLKSSFDVHIPIHKSGVLQSRSIESTTGTENCQNQGSVRECLDKGDQPLSCKQCGKHFSLHSNLKTHIIDCKAKLSLSLSKAEDFSTKKFDFIDSAIVCNDENLIFIDHLDSQFGGEEKAVDPFVTSQSLPLKFPSHPDESAEVTYVFKENIEENCTLYENSVILEVSQDFVKSVNKQVNRRKKILPRSSLSDSLKKSGSTPKRKLKQHLETNKQSFLCDICGKCFSKKFKLSIHMKHHTSKFVCQNCDRKFISQHTLSMHCTAGVCTDEGKTCKYCSSKFSHRKDTLQHIKRVHSGKGKDTQCEFCGKMFYRKSYVVHRRIHTGERPHLCELCGASFLKKCTLQVHLTTHAERKYKCNICDRAFLLKQSLDKHIKRHKGNKDENGHIILSTDRYNCSHCEKSFPSITVLNHHENTHHNLVKIQKSKPFDCSYCGKNYTSIASLKCHEMIHTGEKPFQCSFCNKRFRLRPALINHERTHTGDRPFVCKECGKSFVQRAHLMIHLVLHTGEKPYQCSYCDKAFANQSNLKSHEKLHLKTK